MRGQQVLPEVDAFEVGAGGVERTDDPSVHAEFILQLAGRPAGIADVSPQGEAPVRGEPDGLLLI